MRTPLEAIADILERVVPIGEQHEVNLDEALGQVLSRDVVSDMDLPPFEKSAMDGFAVRRADFAGGASAARLRVLGESRAGEPFQGAVGAGECVAIYTGAEVPEDCDAVVVVEKSEREGEEVLLRDAPRERQNICRRGEDLEIGARVLGAGRRLSAIDLAVLAAVGCDPVTVARRPRVSVLTTGDELVPPTAKPDIGQIREGNTFHLSAMSRLAGCDVTNVGIVPDRPEELERAFGEAIETSDAVITTGGVSMGRYDLVGEAFEKLGVEKVLHKVAIKPGKPIWFGMRGRKPIFGLPGNPVSCLVCHEVFVRPALAKLGGAGESEWRERLRRARWKGEDTRPNDRQQNLPVYVEQVAGGVEVLTPLDWKSSGDIVSLTRAQGLAVVEPGVVLHDGDQTYYRPITPIHVTRG